MTTLKLLSDDPTREDPRREAAPESGAPATSASSAPFAPFAPATVANVGAVGVDFDDPRFGSVRHDWTRSEAEALYRLPLMDLLFHAQRIHRLAFDPNRIQMSRLLSIKTGGCREDCGYCSQSAHHQETTGLSASKLMEIEAVIAEAKKAKEGGATRYCMGAAWRSPKERDMEVVVRMVEGVKALGMETCMTLGMLTNNDVQRLKVAGLDYYNHNIDTSERYYPEITSTRTFADRLDTLARVREAGMKVCSGGIVGMGEAPTDRVDMLVTLANLSEHPESVPINMLVAVPGTPLENAPRIDPIDFVRTIALARIMMPQSFVRLSAGRTEMTDELQAMCFFAGANSIFAGETLLTTANPGEDRDQRLFAKLGLQPLALPSCHEHGQDHDHDHDHGCGGGHGDGHGGGHMKDEDRRSGGAEAVRSAEPVSVCTNDSVRR
ncbi:MAG: biotin synthase BioB [Deltaproteobacteria bacterium]|nr:biotin synthase BioB [Deltaproteobacteria bacterium]